MSDTVERVIRIVREHLGCEADPDTDLATECNMDSLDQVELTMAAEEEFGVNIPDCDVGFTTCAELAQAVDKALGNARA